MRGYVEFLRTPYAARLLGGTLLGRLPTGMGALVVVLFTRAEGGGYSLAGALAAIHGLSGAAGQPVLGRVMDRLGQTRVLLTGALLAAAGFTLFAVVGIDPLPVAVGAVALAGFATPPLEPGLRALWPDVLPGPDQVQAAYALDAAAQEIIFTTGPLIVVAAAAFSPEAALVLTGILGIAGTLVVASARPSRAWRGQPRTADWAGPLRSAGLRLLFLSLSAVGIALGVLSVAVVTYADHHGSESVSGLLLAVNAGGALVGGVVYGARPRTGPANRRLALLMAGFALGFLPLMIAPALPLMLPLTFASGIFLAPVLACSFGIVDRLAPRGTVTEAFAWIVAAFGGGAALGAAAAGISGDLAGVHGAFAPAGVGGVLALCLCLLGRRLLHPADAAVTTKSETETFAA